MYLPDLILLIVSLACIFGAVAVKILDKKREKKALLAVYFIPFFASVIHLLVCRFNLEMLALYAASVFLCLTVFRWKKSIPGIIAHSVLLLVSIVLMAVPIFVRNTNYASMNYAQAFEKMHAYIVNEYPLVDHKGIDFGAMYDAFLPRFEQAQEENSREAYYTALREYVRSIPDGHVALFYLPEVEGMADRMAVSLRDRYIGASLGISVMELDDGKIVVTKVAEDGAAKTAGMRPGDEIVRWDGLPVREAVSDTSIAWFDKNLANGELRRRIQYALLTRAGAGTSVNITYQRDGVQGEVTLVAAKDDMRQLTDDLDTYYHCSAEEDFAWEVIDGHGYIRVKHMYPDDWDATIGIIKEALQHFTDQDVADLIIDVRNNDGGYDEFGAMLLGLFSQEDVFYTQEYLYNPKTHSLEEGKIIQSKAAFSGFDKPVIVLSNHNTVSAGEGFVYNAKKLSNVRTAGLTGTNGSFLSVGDEDVLLMPHNYAVIIPSIVCCDEEGNVMIDSDETGVGGVLPDIRIPLDETAVQELYQEGKDYELLYLMEYLSQ